MARCLPLISLTLCPHFLSPISPPCAPLPSFFPSFHICLLSAARLCPDLSITHSGPLPLAFVTRCHTLFSPFTPSPSICSFCLFALFREDALAKMGIDCAFSSHPFFYVCHCVLRQYMLLLGGDVKSSRNAPCKGKKGDDTITFIVL